VAIPIITISLLGPAHGWGAERPVLDEATVKAGFLFHVTLFVHWPDTMAGAPVVICTASSEAFAVQLAAVVENRNAGSRPIVTRRIDRAADSSGCSVLFIAADYGAGPSAALMRSPGPVLLVGETSQFLREGGLVRLYVEQDRLRFQVDRKGAEARGLRLSSQLLSLAAR
jgi:hypothetical protein